MGIYRSRRKNCNKAKEDKINLNTIYSNFRDMFIITISRPFKIPFKSETLEEMFPKTVEDLLNYYEKNIFKENKD